VYLLEGRKTIHRVALAIMKINEARLLQSDFAQAFNLIKEYRETCEVAELFKVAFGEYRFSGRLIEQLANRHR
jgi:hypothetical protein